MNDDTPKKNIKILVVDDSQFVVSMVSKSLSDEGFTVIEAKSGKDGIIKIMEERPDCMILDLLMPEMTGMDVLSIIKKENLSIPTIILSADIQETTKSRCIENGAVDFINKPMKKEELLKAVKKITNNNMRS